MKNEIDLSKIPVKETAKQSIKANFDGTEKDYEIRALTDGEKLNIGSLISISKDVYRARNLYVCLLSCGLGIEQAVADFLFENVNPEAVRVGDLISKLSNLFDKAKVKEAEEAEKNSEGEVGQS